MFGQVEEVLIVFRVLIKEDVEQVDDYWGGRGIEVKCLIRRRKKTVSSVIGRVVLIRSLGIKDIVLSC